MLWNIAAVVGLLLIAYYVIGLLAEFFRAFYWALWTLIPEAKSHPGRVTIRRVFRHLWYQTRYEFLEGSRYDTKSCRYWRHAYWPWQEPREWYVNSLEDDE